MEQQQIPRPEYPRPQFTRNSWLNLNGEWQFEMDPGKSGISRGLNQDEQKLTQRIIVPFCPESGCQALGILISFQPFGTNEASSFLTTGTADIQYCILERQTTRLRCGLMASMQASIEAVTVLSHSILQMPSSKVKIWLPYMPRMILALAYNRAASRAVPTIHKAATIPARLAYGKQFGLSMCLKHIQNLAVSFQTRRIAACM